MLQKTSWQLLQRAASTLSFKNPSLVFRREVPLNSQAAAAPRPSPHPPSVLTCLAVQMPVAWVIHSREWIPVSIQTAWRSEPPPVLNWGEAPGPTQVCTETATRLSLDCLEGGPDASSPPGVVLDARDGGAVCADSRA